MVLGNFHRALVNHVHFHFHNSFLVKLACFCNAGNATASGGSSYWKQIFVENYNSSNYLNMNEISMFKVGFILFTNTQADKVELRA